jgi:hypothetical protein
MRLDAGRPVLGNDSFASSGLPQMMKTGVKTTAQIRVAETTHLKPGAGGAFKIVLGTRQSACPLQFFCGFGHPSNRGCVSMPANV